jgi:hypothetical protein
LAQREFTIRVERLDQESLVLDGLALARGFFGGVPSSVGEGAFDSASGLGDAERIGLADVIVMNRTMRARSPHKAWTGIVDLEAPWLSALPTDLDLLEADDEHWETAGCDELVAAALAAVIGPGRGMAVATKLLHLKRPRLFPMLDRLVAEMLGVGLANDPNDEQRVTTALRLVRTIRVEGRRNLEPLGNIRAELAREGTPRSLIRIFDAILWFAHPAAGVTGARRTIDVRLRKD